MNPIHFDGVNCIFNKPEGWSDNDCIPLPVKKAHAEDGTPYLMSVWELTEEELQVLLASKKVALYIYGTVLPPVSLTAYKPAFLFFYDYGRAEAPTPINTIEGLVALYQHLLFHKEEVKDPQDFFDKVCAYKFNMTTFGIGDEFNGISLRLLMTEFGLIDQLLKSLSHIFPGKIE